MDKEEIIQKAKEYIERLFAGNADGHDAQHTLRVCQNARFLLESCPEADAFVVLLAALLHDADDYKLLRTENNENARTFLREQGIPEETADTICETINMVSFSKNRGKRPETPEGKIVQDADRLDALGAVGIARTFAYGGKAGRPLEDSIRHFYEKLFLLKDEMNTDAARQIAARRHAYMEAFIREYDNETGKKG